MRRVYKMFREENGILVLDLVIKEEDNKIDIDEQVNDIHLKGITLEEVNMKLKDLDIKEDLKLEIKKGILNKHIGLYEKNRDFIEDKFLGGKKDAVAAKEKMNNTFEEFEVRIKKDFQEIENKFKEFFKNDK